MFEIGTLVTGKRNSGYGVTNASALCIVTNKIDIYDSYGSNDIKVKLIATTDEIDFDNIGKTFDVDSDRFKETSIREYFESHIFAKFIDDISTLLEDSVSETARQIEEIIEKKRKEKQKKKKDRENLQTLIIFPMKRERICGMKSRLC